MQSYLLTPPTQEPMGIPEARAAIKADDDRFDDQLPRAISAARAEAEHETGRRLMTQTWRYEFDDWPADDDYVPELAPTTVAVSYWSTGNAWVTLATNAYAWVPAGPARASIALAPVLHTSWPALGEVAIGPRVRVDVTVGATTAEDVPAEAHQFMAGVVQREILGEQNEYLGAKLNSLRLFR